MIRWDESATGVDEERSDLGRAWPAAVVLAWTAVLVVLALAAAVGLG